MHIKTCSQEFLLLLTQFADRLDVPIRGGVRFPLGPKQPESDHSGEWVGFLLFCCWDDGWNQGFSFGQGHVSQ